MQAKFQRPRFDWQLQLLGSVPIGRGKRTHNELLTQTNSWKSQKPSWKQQSRIPPACRNQSAKLCSTSSRKGSQSIAVCVATANGNASRLVHGENVRYVSIGFCLAPIKCKREIGH